MIDVKTMPVKTNYLLDKNTNVYVSEFREKTFAYSDGEEVEENLLRTILSSTDVSLGSPELLNHICDWPTRYHLSAQRADLLRPMEHLIKGDVLEIGSGCGAITRYLGELGKAKVFALEGSEKRAQITAARCRDLNQVEVYCEDFNSFAIDKKFDVVTLIGVLEYAPMFIKDPFPVQRMLEKAQSFLKKGGKLIIAIENQLGLKYLAGAPEDHLGKKYVGVENRYVQKGPVTFGRRILQNHIKDAGFSEVHFLYPFPDYKFPTAIISEQGCLDEHVDLSDILRNKIKYIQNIPYTSSFNEERVFKTIAQNNLIPDLSNSFLVVASAIADDYKEEALAYTYSNQRRKEFCKENIFKKQGDGYLVKKRKTYPDSKNLSKTVSHVLADEKYIEGNLFINALNVILEKENWTSNDIFQWAKPWIDFISAKSEKLDLDNMPLLDGKYFDAAPFNILISKREKTFELFDMEWSTKEDLRLDYIIFRSLYYSIASVSFISRSAHAAYENFSELVLEILKLYFKLQNLQDLAYFKVRELAILNEIVSPSVRDVFHAKISYHHPVNELQVQQSPAIPPNQDISSDKIVIPPITGTRVQLYWAKEDCSFSEDKSMFEMVELSTNNRIISFNLQSECESIAYLRFDIGSQFGFLNIHSISVRNNTGIQLWSWNPNDIVIKNDCLLIENEDGSNPPSILQVSISDDPYFVIPLPRRNEQVEMDGLSIEIGVSSLSDGQLQLLKCGLLSPLSFNSSSEFKLLTQQIQEEGKEKNRLMEAVQLLTAAQEGLKGQNKALNELIESKEFYKKEIEKDKERLINEINDKAGITAKLFSEKEELGKEISILTTRIAGLENSIHDLNKQHIKSVEQINNLETLKKILDHEKEHFQQAGTKMEELVNKITEQNRSLTEIVNNQQSALQEAINKELSLLKIKDDLRMEINSKDKQLEQSLYSIREKESQLNALSAEVNELKSITMQFQEKYENKSWLEIARDRILKRDNNKNQ